MSENLKFPKVVNQSFECVLPAPRQIIFGCEASARPQLLAASVKVTYRRLFPDPRYLPLASDNLCELISCPQCFREKCSPHWHSYFSSSKLYRHLLWIVTSVRISECNDGNLISGRSISLSGSFQRNCVNCSSIMFEL